PGLELVVVTVVGEGGVVVVVVVKCQPDLGHVPSRVVGVGRLLCPFNGLVVDLFCAGKQPVSAEAAPAAADDEHPDQDADQQAGVLLLPPPPRPVVLVLVGGPAAGPVRAVVRLGLVVRPAVRPGRAVVIIIVPRAAPARAILVFELVVTSHGRLRSAGARSWVFPVLGDDVTVVPDDQPLQGLIRRVFAQP